MAMICENPRCQYHMPKQGIDPRFENACGPIQPNGEQAIVTVKRHLYITRSYYEFHLCDACHSAVELVNGG